MSLYGNYINEVLNNESSNDFYSYDDSASAFFESAMQVSTFNSDVEYFNSIFESTINEFANFEVDVLREYVFIDEADDDKGSGKRNIIMKALDAIVKFFKGLVEKIKSAIGFIKSVFTTIKEKKMEEKARQDIKDLENTLRHSSKGIGISHTKKDENGNEVSSMSGTLNKVFEIANKCEIVGYSNEFKKFIGSIQGPEALKLNFSYQKMSAKGAEGNVASSVLASPTGNSTGAEANSKIMGVLYQLKDNGWKEKFTVRYKRKESDKLDTTLTRFTQIKNDVESYADALKELESYAAKSQKIAEKAKQVVGSNKDPQNALIMHDVNVLSTYGKYVSQVCAFMTTTSNECAKTYSKFCGAMRIGKKYDNSEKTA